MSPKQKSANTDTQIQRVVLVDTSVFYTYLVEALKPCILSNKQKQFQEVLALLFFTVK